MTQIIRLAIEFQGTERLAVRRSLQLTHWVNCGRYACVKRAWDDNFARKFGERGLPSSCCICSSRNIDFEVDDLTFGAQVK